MARGGFGPRTLIDKLWDEHVVVSGRDVGDGAGPDLLYIDVHLLHEMTSPQAFEGLREHGRAVRRPDLTMATEDHNVPTFGPRVRVADPLGRTQLELVRSNCATHEIRLHPMGTPGNGIVHVIGPERGLSQPGATIVCGDSHTSTHGALGALAFGIGTSEVEHVLATQTLWVKRPHGMCIDVAGELPDDATAKDLALHIVAQVGATGGSGYIVEYRGSAIQALTIEQRMTLCNMTIELGARAGVVAPDDLTFAYLRGRQHAPRGKLWDQAVAYWRTLVSDPGAEYDRTIRIDAADVRPTVTWGTSPDQSVSLDAVVPDPGSEADPMRRDAMERALAYMQLSPGTPMAAVEIDTVFIGSCTNGRLEDLRAAAMVLAGRHVAPGVRALVVPGSMAVVAAAEAEGLHEIFRSAGFEWRSSGCSMCTAMNPDLMSAGQRSASTTNRNFEGRQGDGARTHLVSPAVAAATAVRGRLTAPSQLD